MKDTKTYIIIGSITYAMKAKELLNSHGISCLVERTPKNAGSGCGYSLLISQDPVAATRLLSRYRIPHKGVIYRG